jgi:hypothetical protein
MEPCETFTLSLRGYQKQALQSVTISIDNYTDFNCHLQLDALS